MYDVVVEYFDWVKVMSEVYEVFVKCIMVIKVQGKMIDYVGIDSKIGCYLVVDFVIMKLVFVLQVIFVSEIY